MAIYVGILGIVIIVAGLIFSRPSDKKIDLQKLLYGACFVLAGVCLLFWSSLIRIQSGYVGVVTLGGKVQTETLHKGWHIVNPIAKVTKLSTHTQHDKILKQDKARPINNDAIKIASAEGPIVNGKMEIKNAVPTTTVKNLAVTIKKPESTITVNKTPAAIIIADNKQSVKIIINPANGDELNGLNENIKNSQASNTPIPAKKRTKIIRSQLKILKTSLRRQIANLWMIRVSDLPNKWLLL